MPERCASRSSGELLLSGHDRQRSRLKPFNGRHAHRLVDDPPLGGSGAADSPAGDIPPFELAAADLRDRGGFGLAYSAARRDAMAPGVLRMDFGIKHGDIRMLGVAVYGAPVLSTRILVAAGFAQPTLSLAPACALIVAGALIASWRQGAQKKGRRQAGLE
jgi:hypothetical protein